MAERVAPFEAEWRWMLVLKLMLEHNHCGRVELLVWTYVPACDTNVANYVIALQAVMEYESAGGMIDASFQKYRADTIKYLNCLPVAELGNARYVDRDYSPGAPYHHWKPLGPHGRPIEKSRWARASGWMRWW